MARYRVKLSVSITTSPIIIEAKDQKDLSERIEEINLMELLQKYSDGLNIQLLETQRVFDTVPLTFGKEPEKLPALTEKVINPVT